MESSKSQEALHGIVGKESSLLSTAIGKPKLEAKEIIVKIQRFSWMQIRSEHVVDGAPESVPRR